jgi:thiol-disulfide isomerase/thioredoxin
VRSFCSRSAILLVAFATCICIALAMPASALAPWSGGPAPELALKDINGRAHDLMAYRGKVVLINFWATWCEPCRQEMPSIQRLSEKLAGKPFVVLAVNVDEPESRVRNFLNQTRFELPVLLDTNKSATRQWGARLLPVTFIVGADGRVRYRVLGDMDWSSPKAMSVISELLAGG